MTAKTYKKASFRLSSSPLTKKKMMKYNSQYCNNKMTMEECQMAILNHYIRKNEAIVKQAEIESKGIRKIAELMETFLRKHKLICYGGTAINNILPRKAQFYDRQIDSPDFDCYSINPIKHAKELVNMYSKAGYDYVEAKSGVHYGTIKVYVDFINIADITLLDTVLFQHFKEDAIHVQGILYAPANVLRMNAYLEISSPKGYVSRWEKVLHRLNLLNEFFPIKVTKTCTPLSKQLQDESTMTEEETKKLYDTTLETLIDDKVVFFGGYARTFYAKFMPKKKLDDDKDKNVGKRMDFDVLSLDAKDTATKTQKALQEAGFHNVFVRQHPPMGQLIPISYEVLVDNQSVAVVYQPNTCYNYNRVQLHKKEICIATIDTILTFYLAFYYSGRPQYEKERLLCMAQFLFDVQKETKLLQKGILKRFNSSCIGHTNTLAEIMAEKMEKRRLDKNSMEYKLRFFRYVPV